MTADEKFSTVKRRANELGLTTQQLIDAVKVIQLAKDLNILVYERDGKLRMFDATPKSKKEEKKKESGMDDIFGRFGDIFDGSFFKKKP